MTHSFNAFYYFTDLFTWLMLTLPLFFLIPWAVVRRILLALSGFYLLFVIAPRLAFFYLAFWLAVWIAQRFLAFFKFERAIVLILFIIIFLLPMVIWKLFPTEFNIQFNFVWHDFVWYLSQRLGEIDMIRQILIPIGLSFATFRAIDLLIQTDLGLIKGLSLDRLLFFGFFPPVLIIGPIIEYHEVEKGGDRAVHFDVNDFAYGLGRIFIGIAKIFVLAYPLQQTADIFVYFEHNSIFVLWISLFLFAWFFYLNFAGYSDLAIGTARLYGFHLKENFSFPYFQQNPQAFWAHWHMSLTRFAQRNVFIPFGGFRKKTQYFAIVATIMMIALWHDLSLSLILFGIYHAIGLCVHRYWDNRRKAFQGQPSSAMGWVLLKIGGTFLFVMFSFPLLMLPYSQLVDFYGAMFGF